MARAKRYYLPGHIWYITHRCHKKEFLLKFARVINEALINDRLQRESHWTQSVAVGDKEVLQSVKERLNHHVQGRYVESTESGSFQLREAQTSYGLKSFKYSNTFVWS